MIGFQKFLNPSLCLGKWKIFERISASFPFSCLHYHLPLAIQQHNVFFSIRKTHTKKKKNRQNTSSASSLKIMKSTNMGSIHIPTTNTCLVTCCSLDWSFFMERRNGLKFSFPTLLKIRRGPQSWNLVRCRE